MNIKLDWGTIRRRISRLALDYKDAEAENAHAQMFWRDLLQCYGVQLRQVGGFEQRAARSDTGGNGRIDFFWPGVVIGEAKSRNLIDADGEPAIAQALAYLQGGDVPAAEQPRYVMASDFATIVVLDLEDPEGSRTRIPLDQLAQRAEALAFLRDEDPSQYELREQETASIEAARIMGRLYSALTDDADLKWADVGAPSVVAESKAEHQAAIFLTRVLFLMYADDARVWESNLFARYLRDHTAEDGSDTASKLRDLFRILDTPPDRRSSRMPEALKAFPYVNGSVFAQSDALDDTYFDETMRAELLAACEFDWAKISPAVFGSLFQTVKSKKARRLAGEHYTTEENILKVLRPLLLDGYALRVEKARYDASELMKIRRELLANVYLDPACGCGNFLLIAYRELRRIELQAITYERDLQGISGAQAVDVTLGLNVSLEQFYGFEIGEWPARIAATAMFLADHQANLEMQDTLGWAPDRLPLTSSSHIIVCNSLQVDWNSLLPKDTARHAALHADRRRIFIFGNPPFVGARKKTAEQKADLIAAWNGTTQISDLDLVTGWHAKAIETLADRDGTFAYVSTNSVAQGIQVALLHKPLRAAGWVVSFAHQTFAWTSEAPGKAAVHCVITGFTRDRSSNHLLWSYEKPTASSTFERVATINGYLFDGPDVLVDQRRKVLSPQLPPVNYGSMPNDDGNLLVEIEEYDDVRKDEIATKYLRPYRMGEELIHNLDRWCLWMPTPVPEDIHKSSVLRDRLEGVRAARLKSSRAATNKLAETPYRFAEIRQPQAPYVAIPAVVSESRLFYTAALLPPDVIAGNKLFVADDPDGFLFGVVSSSVFVTWQKTIGGRIKSDPNFANTVVWNTLPMPAITDSERDAIAEAGRGVLKARALHPNRTLAEAYDPLAMDPALLSAHRKLDRLVDKAFGAARLLNTNEQRRSLLFKNYVELTRAA